MVARQAASALDGKNLSAFLTEVASGVRSLLLEHFRKFTVSLEGGLIVSRDATKYVELVRSWPLQDGFDEDGGMDIVVEVANLFVVGPEALREKLRNVSPAEAAEFRAYVARREDSSSVGVQSVLSAL